MQRLFPYESACVTLGQVRWSLGQERINRTLYICVIFLLTTSLCSEQFDFVKQLKVLLCSHSYYHSSDLGSISIYSPLKVLGPLFQ